MRPLPAIWLDFSDLADRFGESVLPLTLDVTDPKQARDVVAQAHAHFANLDVSATSGIVKNRQITAGIYLSARLRRVQVSGCICLYGVVNRHGKLPHQC